MYVYVHLTVKASRCQFASFLDKMESERHIMPFEIFGYESFTHDTKDGSLVEHVGFKVLLNHYQPKNPSFKSCTDGVEGVVRGLLWENDYAERIRECLQSRNASMAKFFADVQMKAALCGQHEECIELMRDEIRAYEERIQRCKTRLRELNQCKFAFLVLKDRIAVRHRNFCSNLIISDGPSFRRGRMAVKKSPLIVCFHSSNPHVYVVLDILPEHVLQQHGLRVRQGDHGAQHVAAQGVERGVWVLGREGEH